MLGSEYNWLFSLRRTSTGLPRIRVASETLLTLGIAVFCFLAVALHATPTPTSTDRSTWGITEMDGIIEGMAIHSATGEAFFSDVRNRCIWFRDVSGSSAAMKKFSRDTDGLLGVFALKIDATGRTLWASSSAVPEMKGYTAADRGNSFLAAYDLPTRTLRRIYSLPADGRAHVLGDFLLADSGAIFATDSFAPVIWRLAPGGDRLEAWLEHPGFKSLQGIAAAADGRALYVTDYSRGLWRVDLATRTPTLLSAPADFNLRGLDGLYAVPGGLIGVQNGLNPPRIVRLTLDENGAPASARVLSAESTPLADLSLGQVVGDRFQFIGGSGWDLFPTPAASPAPRTVTIHNTPLD